MQLRRVLLFLFTVCFAASGAPLTFFYFTSSPTSWVGHGESAFVTPAQGFTFRDYSGSWAELDILASMGSPWWGLIFGAADGQPLTIGKYPNAATPGSQVAGVAVLSFFGNGRGNQSTGQFEIFDVTRSPDGHLLSFAATFVQFDEGQPDAWNYGIVSFNSTAFAQAPEPESITAVGAGLALVIGLRLLRTSV